MNRFVPLASIALLVACGIVLVAHADAPPPPAPVASSTDAAVAGSATAPAAVDETLPPALAKQAVPTVRSALPQGDAWKEATLVEPSRRSIRAAPCRVFVLREWVKVHCPFPLAGIRQHTGNAKDVQIWVTPKSMDGGGLFDPPHGGQVVFPLVPGEARMFQFFELDADWYSSMPFPAESVIVDSFWIQGRPTPEIILR